MHESTTPDLDPVLLWLNMQYEERPEVRPQFLAFAIALGYVIELPQNMRYDVPVKKEKHHEKKPGLG
jgi:hypothetical protein